MVAAVLIGVMASSIYAASATVYIHIGDGPVQSAAILSSGASYTGGNEATSGHRLHLTLQYYSGSGWVDDKVSTMAIGAGIMGQSTDTRYGSWRVQLNPDLWYTDCNGWADVYTPIR